jgi:CBS domain-containing protein
MTDNVVSVTAEAPYKAIVETLAQHGVSAVPVVDDGREVLGVVSEADLLHMIKFTALEPHVHLLERKQRRVALAKASGISPAT